LDVCEETVAVIDSKSLKSMDVDVNLGVAWTTSTDVSLSGNNRFSVVCDSQLVSIRKVTKSTEVLVLVVFREFSIVVSIIEIVVSHADFISETRGQNSG